MGNIRRIKNRMTNPVAMADTKIAFNNCKVFLGSPNPTIATKAAGQFVDFMKFLDSRAKCVNMGDLYEAHLQVLERMESGKALVN